MAIKSSKVTNVQGNGTWDGKYGLMYKFDVEMENGDHGEYSSKSQDQNKFVVGENVEYEHSFNEYNGNKYYKIKPVSTFQPRNNFSSPKSNDQQKSIEYQSMLRTASIFLANRNLSRVDLTKAADELYDWLQVKKNENNNNTKVTADTFDGSDLPF